MGAALMVIAEVVFQIPSNGIKSGRQIQRTCIRCNTNYIGWSDDTITIKGPMRPHGLCPACCHDDAEKIINDTDWNAFENNMIGNNRHVNQIE